MATTPRKQGNGRGNTAPRQQRPATTTPQPPKQTPPEKEVTQPNTPPEGAMPPADNPPPTPPVDESKGATESGAGDDSNAGGDSGAPGLTEDQIKEVVDISTETAQRGRERQLSEREKALAAAIEQRKQRTSNPHLDAITNNQAVVQEQPKLPNVAPAVQEAYDTINNTMDEYLAYMEPPKSVDAKTAATQQYNLYMLIKSILTKGGPELRHSMAYLLTIIREHRNTAFASTYILRGLPDMRGTEMEKEFYRLTMQVLVVLSDPDGLALRIQRIDIPRLRKAAQLIEGPHNTAIANNLNVFLTGYIKRAG